MGAFDASFATDEDVAEVARGDYPLLVEEWSTKADGDDGNFDAGQPWNLLSNATDFAVRGVEVGHVCVLGRGHAQRLDVLGVAAVAAGSVTLRRIGQPAGEGQPPGPIAGATGRTYRFPTCGPALRTATLEIKRQLRVKDDAWLEAATDLRRAVVLYVLADMYDAQWRDMTNSSWRTKAKEKRDELAALLGNLNQTYGIGMPGRRPEAGILSLGDALSWRVPRIGD